MMFHVKPFAKALSCKGFSLLLLMLFAVACITPRHTVEIQEYTLMPNGKEVLGREQGLTAFIFEANQSKIPFSQYVGLKYNLPKYTEVEYWVTIDGRRFKVLVYDNDELMKYFDISQFMITKVETAPNIKSKANFIAVSVINEANEDCLSNDSLFQPMVIEYLRALRNEYYNS